MSSNAFARELKNSGTDSGSSGHDLEVRFAPIAQLLDLPLATHRNHRN